MFNIVTIDGGGIRGLIPTILMQKIVRDIPDFLDKVNMLAGASTGGIIALALANGTSLETLFNLYSQKSSSIFTDSQRWAVERPFKAKYDNTNLKAELLNVFGDSKIGDLKKHVIIPSFSITGIVQESMLGNGRFVKLDNPTCWTPKIFDSQNQSCMNFLCRDVALYTCSAPTYFQATNGYIDGGVVANNPSTLALAAAISHMNSNTLGADHMKDISLLSFGTGRNLKYISDPDYDAGYAWILNIVDLILDGVNDVSDAQCEQFLGNHYLRVQSDLPKQCQMDDVSEISYIINVAKYLAIDNVLSWIRGIYA